jgi:hypothetical protein
MSCADSIATQDEIHTVDEMTSINLSRLAIMLLLVSPSAYGDSVTTTDNLSINGTIKGLTDTTINLEARFPSGITSYSIQRSKVVRIDFNFITYNSGAPPKTFGLGPSAGGETASRPQDPQTDTIVLKGNSRRPCRLAAVDADTIHCTDSAYPRNQSLYVLVGQRR